MGKQHPHRFAVAGSCAAWLTCRRMNSFDVAILGGGPAGSCAACFLASQGHSVWLAEKERFPRFHIGESLLPFSMDTLERMQLGPKLSAAGFLPKHGAQITSGCGTRDLKFYFKNSFRSRRETAYQVPRAEFDHLLLQQAREAGAEVHEATRVKTVDFEDTHARIDFEQDGSPGTIRASYVLDATGRHSLVAAKYGLKRPYPGLRKMAIYAHYEGVEVPEGDDGTLTTLLREDDGWFWVIPLSRKKISLGWVMDLEDFRRAGQSPEFLFEARIQRQPLILERIQGGVRVTEVLASGDYSYRQERLTGERWMLAGDAAGFIDPVFSSGVFLALFSGEHAAEALHQSLLDPSARARAFQRYEKNLRRVMDFYYSFVQGWYRREFIETLFNPKEFFEMVPAVNALLAGNPGRDFSLLWRLGLFRFFVALQRWLPLSPRLSLNPQHPDSAPPVPLVGNAS